MIRVVHLITALSVGGAQRMLYNFITRSDTRKFRHQVVSMLDLGPVGADLVAAGFEVRTVGMRPGVPSLAALFRLVRMLRRLRPHVLHCWMYHANLMGLMAGRLAGVPNILWSIRSSNESLVGYRPLTRWVVKLGAWFSGRCDVLIVNSEAGRSVHEAWGYDAAKMLVVPNGFDLGLFKPDASARGSVRRELRIDEGAVLIGLLARFHPLKDHETFLKAAKLLTDSDPRVQFLMVGQGVSGANPVICRMIRETGLNRNAHLLGRRDDIPRLVASLDMACLSSWSEAFPNVVGEAMACGVPCVVTDVGEAARIVGDTGRVVPTRNPEALASALAELVKMDSQARLELGLRARRRIEENFPIQNLVDSYESLYEKLCPGRDN